MIVKTKKSIFLLLLFVSFVGPFVSSIGWGLELSAKELAELKRHCGTLKNAEVPPSPVIDQGNMGGCTAAACCPLIHPLLRKQNRQVSDQQQIAYADVVSRIPDREKRFHPQMGGGNRLFFTLFDFLFRDVPGGPQGPSCLTSNEYLLEDAKGCRVYHPSMAKLDQHKQELLKALAAIKDQAERKRHVATINHPVIHQVFSAKGNLLMKQLLDSIDVETPLEVAVCLNVVENKASRCEKHAMVVTGIRNEGGTCQIQLQNSHGYIGWPHGSDAADQDAKSGRGWIALERFVAALDKDEPYFLYLREGQVGSPQVVKTVVNDDSNSFIERFYENVGKGASRKNLLQRETKLFETKEEKSYEETLVDFDQNGELEKERINTLVLNKSANSLSLVQAIYPKADIYHGLGIQVKKTYDPSTQSWKEVEGEIYKKVKKGEFTYTDLKVGTIEPDGTIRWTGGKEEANALGASKTGKAELAKLMATTFTPEDREWIEKVQGADQLASPDPNAAEIKNLLKRQQELTSMKVEPDDEYFLDYFQELMSIRKRLRELTK